MLDEVLRERLGVGDELVGDDVGGLPALLVEGVLGGGRAHRGVPHRQRELLVAERPGAVERVGGAHRDAHDSGILRLAAGRAAEVEVAGRDDQLRALVDQLDRGVADRDRVGLAVDVEKAHLLAEQAARVVDLLDRDLRALEPGLVERRLHAGQADSAADQDFRARLTRRGEHPRQRQCQRSLPLPHPRSPVSSVRDGSRPRASTPGILARSAPKRERGGSERARTRGRTCAQDRSPAAYEDVADAALWP